MIHYQLRCGQDHEFDGWFKDSTTFDKQAARGLVACPSCGDVKVTRAMMAPALSTRAAEPPRPAPPAPPKDSVKTGVVAGPMPDQMRAMLQRMRAEIEANCDHVGDRFAEEARRIHRGEAEARGIYGEATQEEAESLAEDGVAVSRIPWVPRAES
jgi:hypothetical protein